MNNNNSNNNENNMYSIWNENISENNNLNGVRNQVNNNNPSYQGNNIPRDTDNKMYTKWNENVREGYKPEEKPYLVMSDKELKNKKRINVALRLVIYGIFIIIGGMLVYMYQLDKYEFYPVKEEVIIANKSKYQVEIIPKNAGVFEYLNYKYEIEDERIAEVNEYGEVRGKEEGETELKIRYKNGIKEKKVKIKVENIEVKTIEVEDEKGGKLEEGESVEIKTIVNGQEEIQKELECRSSDERVITIDEECRTITPKEEGVASIIIEDPEGAERKEIEYVVEAEKVEVEKIEISESKIRIKKGTKGKIEAEAKPENAEGRKLKYKSENGKVEVDEEGVIYGKEAGTSVIEIESENGKKGYVTVEIEDESIEIDEIKIKEEIKTIKEGEEKELKVEIEPSNATERELSWESSNPKVIEVKNGKIKGISVGEAEITVKTSSGKEAKIIIEVKSKEIKVEKIKISEKKVSIEKGSKYIIGTEIEPNNATNKKLKYTSSNENISVDATGVVYAHNVGKSIVTIESANGIKEIVEIEVVERKVEPTGIKISSTKKEMVKGETSELTITIEPNDATVRTVSWTSSNKNVVSVVNGKITAQGGGSAEIIAKTANGKEARCEVIVRVPVEKLSLEGQDRIKVKGETIYKVVIEPNDATNKVVVWESTNSSVGSVDSNGKVIGKTVGETKIRATIDGKSIEKKIIVESVEKVVETIILEPQNIEMKEGENKEIKVTILPNDAKDKNIEWTSSNSKVATIEKGTVKAIGVGEAEIKVQTKDKRVSAICKIKVNPKVIEVSEIKITGETIIKIKKNSKYTIPVEVIPNNANDKTLTYKSNNNNVVVDKAGVVTGKSVGKSTVTVTSKNGKTANIEIEVQEKEIKPTNVTISETNKTIKVGESVTLTEKIEPNDATLRTVTWTSSNSKVASVANGKITGLSSGSTVIVVKTTNGLEAKCNVTVVQPVTKVIISGENKIKVKGVTQYTASVEPANASDKSITWSSSNSNVAIVDSSGKVTGIGAGSAVIKGTTKDGVYGEKTIVVEKETIHVKELKINPESVTIKEGETTNLSVDIKPSGAVENITWESSNTKIVTVNNKGEIKGIKTGETTIIVKSANGIKATRKVIVKHVEVSVTKISLNITSTSKTDGESLNLKATIEPSNATNKNITWSTSDKNIATVDNNGKVTIGSKTGTVTITAKSNNGKTATCTILVKSKVVNVKSITLNKNDEVVEVKKELELKATVEPSNATNKIVTWQSSNNEVAEVKEGKISFKKAGNISITAKTSNGKIATCKIKVVDHDNPTIFEQKNEAVREYFNMISSIRNNIEDEKISSNAKKEAIKIYNKNDCQKDNHYKCYKPAIYNEFKGNIKVYDINKTNLIAEKIDISKLSLVTTPNNTYYIESENGKYDYIKISDGVRMLNIDEVRNVRDLGGWNADGGKIKYGKIYRGYNPNTQNASKTEKDFNLLNIQSIIDLRTKNEISKDKGTIDNKKITKKNITISQYRATTSSNVRKVVSQIMSDIVSNKNVYFHCQVGTDRTGTIAYLVEGILGVNQNDRCDDYRMSCFASNNGGTCHNCISNFDTKDEKTINKLINTYNGVGQEKFINWFLDQSSNKEDDLKLINDFRSKMIDGNPQKYKLSNGIAIDEKKKR